jgi:hypothetical protein
VSEILSSARTACAATSASVADTMSTSTNAECIILCLAASFMIVGLRFHDRKVRPRTITNNADYSQDMVAGPLVAEVSKSFEAAMTCGQTCDYDYAQHLCLKEGRSSQMIAGDKALICGN